MERPASPIPFGKYELLERIAIGGMAEVFRARILGEGGFEKHLVIKRILPHLSNDAEFVHMLIDEAKIAGCLYHPNIIQIYDLGKIDGNYFIAMEFIEGGDLKVVLRRCAELEKAIPPEHAVYITTEVLKGLEYAHVKTAPAKDSPLHLQIIHRDVSPPNILLSYEGEVKIVDFGIAKAATRVMETSAGILKGKFEYMSPEQASGLALDSRSDLFSTGLILYEMLVGRSPFAGQTDMQVLNDVRNAKIIPPRKSNPEIPLRLEQITLKALMKDPADRYQRAADMRNDLMTFAYEERFVSSAPKLASFMHSLFEEDARAGRPATVGLLEVAPDSSNLARQPRELPPPSRTQAPANDARRESGSGAGRASTLDVGRASSVDAGRAEAAAGESDGTTDTEEAVTMAGVPVPEMVDQRKDPSLEAAQWKKKRDGGGEAEAGFLQDLLEDSSVSARPPDSLPPPQETDPRARAASSPVAVSFFHGPDPDLEARPVPLTYGFEDEDEVATTIQEMPTGAPSVQPRKDNLAISSVSDRASPAALESRTLEPEVDSPTDLGGQAPTSPEEARASGDDLAFGEPRSPKPQVAGPSESEKATSEPEMPVFNAGRLPEGEKKDGEEGAGGGQGRYAETRQDLPVIGLEAKSETPATSFNETRLDLQYPAAASRPKPGPEKNAAFLETRDDLPSHTPPSQGEARSVSAAYVETRDNPPARDTSPATSATPNSAAYAETRQNIRAAAPILAPIGERHQASKGRKLAYLTGFLAGLLPGLLTAVYISSQAAKPEPTPEPLPSEEKGTLVIRTENGIETFLNENPMGSEYPLELKLAPHREHLIRLAKPGTNDYEVPIRVAPNGSVVLVVPMVSQAEPPSSETVDPP